MEARAADTPPMHQPLMERGGRAENQLAKEATLSRQHSVITSVHRVINIIIKRHYVKAAGEK